MVWCSKNFFTIFGITMSNVEIFDTTFAMTILVIMALCIPAALLVANWFLHPGKIKHTIIKGSAYECGLAHVSGTANERYPVKYYMVAMLFLVFDLEVAFIIPGQSSSLLAVGNSCSSSSVSSSFSNRVTSTS